MHQLIDLVTRYGLALVFLNVLAEQIGAPIPAVPTMIVAGALARDGHFSFRLLIIFAVLASLIADCIWFFAGRRYGHRVLGLLCRISLSPDSCVKRTESFFERWGLASLVFAKFIPGFSTVAPPLAGATPRARFGAFLFFDAAGALLWSGASFAAGAIFHRAIDRVLLGLENLGSWALLFIGSLLALFIAWRWWERKRFMRVLRMSRITPQELQDEMLSSLAPLVVDVRGSHARVARPEIIPGAIVLDTRDLDRTVVNLPRDRDIVLYCT